jgi:hypothetical protein
MNAVVRAIMGPLVLAFLLLAWWLYQRRDLRVSGEGNWNLGLPAPNKPAAEAKA